MVRKFYSLDPMQLTYRSFLIYLEQLPRVRAWEQGEDPDTNRAKKLSTEDFVEQLLAGNVTPEDLEDKGPREPVPDEKKRQIERQIADMFGVKNGGSQIYGRL